MKVELEPGVYVLAVSGGVDSMVLLDVLRQRDDIRLVVAHLDHGIRPDSNIDRQLVQEVANKHGLVFVYDEVKLGGEASEAAARKARYRFLRRVQQATGADAIITAHHQDDLIETAILNLMRGTGRKGLSSLASDKNLRRPLLHLPKSQLKAYAKKHNLTWREDTTNQDDKYRRNYIRQHIVNKLGSKQHAQLTKLLSETKTKNQEIDIQIANLLQFVCKGKEIDRRLFITLPHSVALEVIAAWLRNYDIRQFDKKLLEKLVIASKTLAPGKQIDIDARHIIKVSKEKLALGLQERY